MVTSGSPISFLILARHAGEPGSGGGRRPVLLAQALAKAGHTVRLVTPFRPSLPLVGVELDIVPLITAYEVNGPNDPEKVTAEEDAHPVTLSQIILDRLPAPWALAIRRWKYIPDFELIWANAVRTNLMEKNLSFDWVLTTSPPESLHVHGAQIAKHVGGHWIMEWRDGWTVNNHRTHVRGLRRRIESRLAKRCLAKADAVVSIDDEITKEVLDLCQKLDRAGGPPPVLTLGHFSQPHIGPSAKLDNDRFHLVHAGGLSLSYRRREVSVLLAALEPVALRRAEQGFAPLVLHILGRLTDVEQEALISSPLECICHGPVSLRDSRKIQAGANALLLWIPNESLALPGKYAEYVQSKRPVAYLGPDKLRAKAPAGGDFIDVESLSNQDIHFKTLNDRLTDVDYAAAEFLAFIQPIGTSD